MTTINATSYGWQERNEGLSDPYVRSAVLPYSDTVDIVAGDGVLDPPRCMLFLASGNVAFLLINDTASAAVVPVTAGQSLAGLVKRVLATGTTVGAGNVLGLW